MNLDLKLLTKRFLQAEEEESVSAEEVNPYLLEYVIRPLLRGETVRYGEIDYGEFEDFDLRAASHYCDGIYSVAHRLEQFAGDVANTAPAPLRQRVFC